MNEVFPEASWCHSNDCDTDPTVTELKIQPSTTYCDKQPWIKQITWVQGCLSDSEHQDISDPTSSWQNHFLFLFLIDT